MLRRVLSFVLVLGVFAHAAALVRHNAVMIEAHLNRAMLIADLMVICHPSGSGTIDRALLPDVPMPTDAQNDCPVCAGLGGTFALVVPELAPHYLRFDPLLQRPTRVAAPVERSPILLPPVRGPPSLA
jgi:hypothetical protein